MSSIDKIARERLKAQDPFHQLDRDLPKGGRQMKIAEPLGESPLPAAAAAGSRLVAPAVAAGMLIPTSIGEEQPIVDTGNKGVAGPLPSEMKGSPQMQEMTAPTRITKEQAFKQRFEQEGKKHLSPEFKVDVPVEYEDEGTGAKEKYTLEMRSKNKLSDRQKMKAAGIDAAIGTGKGGQINLPKKSTTNKTYLEEDDD